jgi:hypothetical protein
VHMKVIDETAAGILKASVCANGQEPSVHGALDGSPLSRHELLLNLRAVGEPEPVRRIVEEAARGIAGHVIWQRLDCFSPAAPKPERRGTL